MISGVLVYRFPNRHSNEIPYDRINWTGTALNTFYAAVRKALIVVIILRAIGVLLAIGVGSWWLLKYE